MTGVDALSLIVAVLVLPLLTAVFTRPGMTPALKRWISVGVAALLGGLSAIVSGQLGDLVPPEASAWVIRILVWVATVAVAGQAAYKLLADPAEAIEAATSPAPAEPAPVPGSVTEGEHGPEYTAETQP